MASNSGVMQRFKGKIKAKLLLLSTSAIWINAGGTNIQMPNVWSNAGAPVNGGAGTLFGIALPGDLLVDTTNKKLYMNTNTSVSPTWTIFEAAGGNVVFSSADALTAHAGGTKAAALPLVANINTISVCATALDSVLAPPAGGGGVAVITNNGAAGCAVYGAVNDTINGVATATAYWLAPGQTVVLWSTVAGKWNATIASAAATYQAQPANPTAPNSTAAFTMQGIAGAITPNKSGKVVLMISGNLISSVTTAGDGILAQLSYGTGAAPGSNAALAGTQVGNILEYTNPATVVAADVFTPFSMQVVVTGLTLGTAYWYDLAAKAVANASHIGLANLSVSAFEL